MRMKKVLIIVVMAWMGLQLVHAQNQSDMDRTTSCKENFRLLFGGEALTGQGADPELMDILQKFIFGEVFATGELSMKQRELITCVCLATMQTLPQLEAHAGAALNVGVSPLELREAMYQCAPFVGFPRVLNAVERINRVLTSRGIALPLDKQGQVDEEERHAEGAKIQMPLYGDEIRQDMRSLPAGMGDAVSDFLTEVCFGDFYTRGALDVPTRELLSLCVLATLGATPQLEAHVAGCIKAGLTKDTLYAAMIQCLPYIGFPGALNAIRAIRDNH